ncbi:MAG: 4Fe-4S binding protein [archaeon]|nr:4Fe-4S binding protein [archaeon]MCP8320713.1 4Fe-4S binding protein [archaeon]
MKRPIAVIDEAICNGCEECVPVCKLGAISMVSGKAKITPELCDGLGLCILHCPVEAITLKIVDTAPPLEKTVEHMREHIELFAMGIGLEHMHEHHEEHKIGHKHH